MGGELQSRNCSPDCASGDISAGRTSTARHSETAGVQDHQSSASGTDFATVTRSGRVCADVQHLALANLKLIGAFIKKYVYRACRKRFEDLPSELLVPYMEACREWDGSYAISTMVFCKCKYWMIKNQHKWSMFTAPVSLKSENPEVTKQKMAFTSQIWLPLPDVEEPFKPEAEEIRLDHLDEREREIVRLQLEGRNGVYIAKKLKITKQRVSQMIIKIRKKIKNLCILSRSKTGI